MLTFTPTIQLLDVSMAGAYLEFLRKLDAESPYMHYAPGERQMTEQGMRSRLKKQEKQGNSFVIVALGLDGSIIGYFSVNGGNSLATKHSATVAVGVLAAYRGQGVAHDLISFAEKHSRWNRVVRWECTVVYDNEPAVGFYIAHGFCVCGTLINRFRKDGKFLLDEFVMERLL